MKIKLLMISFFILLNSLDCLASSLEVRSDLSGAEVYLNDALLGLVSEYDYLNVGREKFYILKKSDIAEGRYKIICKLNGFLPYEKTVDIANMENEIIVVRFKDKSKDAYYRSFFNNRESFFNYEYDFSVSNINYNAFEGEKSNGKSLGGSFVASVDKSYFFRSGLNLVLGEVKGLSILLSGGLGRKYLGVEAGYRVNLFKDFIRNYGNQYFLQLNIGWHFNNYLDYSLYYRHNLNSYSYDKSNELGIKIGFGLDGSIDFKNPEHRK